MKFGVPRANLTFKHRTAIFIFSYFPFFITAPLFIVWRSTNGRNRFGLDHLLRVPKRNVAFYEFMLRQVAKIPCFSVGTQFVLDYASVADRINALVEYGSGSQPPDGGDASVEAVRRILHHQEFSIAGSSQRCSEVISDDSVFDDGNRLNDAISKLADFSKEMRAIVGGWFFYIIRQLLLIKYHDGRGEEVPKLGANMQRLQEVLSTDKPAPSRDLSRILDSFGVKFDDLRLISPDWSALIGHMGHLDVHLKMREMGWWTGSPLLATYPVKIANRPFLSLLAERCPTLILDEGLSREVWVELCGLAKYFGVSHQIWGSGDRPVKYWNDWGGAGLAEWTARGGGFPLRKSYDRSFLKTGDIEQIFSTMLREHGMTDTDWHVCLHMRDAGARGDKEGHGESVRNTHFKEYLDAIRYITDQGGWVIRMGGPTVPPLPKMERVIDYARGAFRSALMDLHLVRTSRFFIGTTSGFAYVASSFGIPAAMVNGVSSIGLLWNDNMRFALKPIREKSGRLLTQNDLTSDRWRWAFPTYETLERAGLTICSSSSDEIYETVKEIDLLARDEKYQTSETLTKEWRKSLGIPYFYGASQPSAYFLEKYKKDFLP